MHQTRLTLRLHSLLAALRNGPLSRPNLLERLGDVYPATASRRVMVDRDIKYLVELGILIEKSNTRPPVYTLHGGTPIYTNASLRMLALVRESFGLHHPQAAEIRSLLELLTVGLTSAQSTVYTQHPTSLVPLQPAIDYAPHAVTIARLEQAISGREIINFHYTNSQGRSSKHKVEPYEIEYYERHFYLVAYSIDTRQTLDYRVDRMSSIKSVHTLPPELSGTHTRETITFRYRLAAPLARGEISQRFDNQRIVERLASGDAIIEAEGRSDFFIVQLLLRYRGNAELLEPAWLREKMATEVRALAAVYAVQGK